MSCKSVIRAENKSKLENVRWSSVPVQIGDPIVAPPGEYVLKNIGIQV